MKYALKSRATTSQQQGSIKKFQRVMFGNKPCYSLTPDKQNIRSHSPKWKKEDNIEKESLTVSTRNIQTQ